MIKRRNYRYQEQAEIRDMLKRFLSQQQYSIMNFPANPAITPIPTAANWIYSNYPGFTATLANSSTAVTAVNIGTSMLAVGQVVTGAGIVNNPPTTIAALPSATTITLSQNTTASASGTGVALNFQGFPGLNSPTFSNNTFFAQPAVSAVDVLGCVFAIPEVQVLNAGSTFIPAPGLGLLALASGTTAMTVQLQTAAGTWTSIFSGTVSVTSYYQGLLDFDGGNVRINCPTTAGGFTLYRLRNPAYY